MVQLIVGDYIQSGYFAIIAGYLTQFTKHIPVSTTVVSAKYWILSYTLIKYSTWIVRPQT